MRDGKVVLRDAYARVEGRRGVALRHAHQPVHAFSRPDLDPDRRRKLLLHRTEYVELQPATAGAGRCRLIPAEAPTSRIGG